MGMKDAEETKPDLGSGGRAESWLKLSTSVAIVAATLLAVFVNVLSARHYARWDVSRAQLFTLSDGTLDTLRNLGEPVKLVVLLSQSDPQEMVVSELLEAYQAETKQLVVEHVDPDRNPAEFVATQQKYNLRAGRAEDGRVTADAAVIAVNGDRTFFVTPDDLVEVDDADDTRVKPKLEQALTGAIRNVLDDERPRVCVTSGHGERGLDEGGDTGLAYLRERLLKNNYEVTSVFGEGAPGAAPLEGCSLLLVAGPTEVVPRDQVAAMVAFVEAGGNALIVAGPVPNEADRDYVDLGLDPLIALAGVKLQRDFVFELDEARRSVRGFGETFLPKLETHPVTRALQREEARGASVVLTVASSLEKTRTEGTSPLLVTSDKAFGLVDFFGWAKNPTAPKKADADHAGPLVIASAAERAPVAGKARGARIVVVSSQSALFGANWRQPELRGTSLFVENAVSWLASHRAFVDIPTRPAVTSSMRLTQSTLDSVFYFVVMTIPAALAVFGTLVYLRRRKPRRKTS